MAKRILVPVDHTTDHEAMLSYVAAIARGQGATVKLLHVAPAPVNVLNAEGQVVAYVDQEMRRIEHEWLVALHANELVLEGVSNERAVRFGDPVDEILTEAEIFDADLIVVTTRCASGVKRSLLGSVPEQLVKRAKAAVLLLRPALA